MYAAMNNLEKIRKEKGISLNALIKGTGFSRQYIYLLRNADDIPASAVPSLAKALRCKPEDISDEFKLEGADNIESLPLPVINPRLLAEVIRTVKTLRSDLDDGTVAAAVAMVYQQAAKFNEKPTQSSAALAIEQALRDLKNGREMEQHPPNE